MARTLRAWFVNSALLRMIASLATVFAFGSLISVERQWCGRRKEDTPIRNLNTAATS
jgi:hypothetical protein